ncbi:MAG: hypothetical protein RLZZ337_1088 [Bacteroidota bacterium]
MKLDRSKYLESRSLKPFTLFLAIVAVNVLLGIIALAFPTNGVSIGKNFKLKFTSISELFETPKVEPSANINEILSGVDVKESLPSEVVAFSGGQDSIVKKIKAEIRSSANYDSTTKKLTPPKPRSIQLPPNNPNALKMLISALKNESKEKVVRIIHYGDSQLEGDRITDYLRNRLQQLFGGNGPGIVLPLEPAANSRRSVFVSQSNNFVKKAIYVKGQKAPNNEYGIGAATFLINGSHSSFVKMAEPSNEKEQDGDGQKAEFTKSAQSVAYISIKNGTSAYPLAKTYSNIRLLYQSQTPFKVKLQSDDSVIEDILREAPSYAAKSWNLNTERKLKIDFVAGEFPKIFGLALDGNTGVAVDNFAMRGSSAVGFDDLSKPLYQKQLKDLNVRCIIFQYGINVIPNVRSDYSYYKKILSTQLKSVISAYPGVSIIVVGPSDMSKNQNGSMVSYSNIPLINKAMKEAAFENGCAFWDLYEAMGDKNAMVEWQNNGLARKDYTHFSYKGAKYVGEMLFEAILEQLQ